MPEHRNHKRESFCQEFLVDLNGAAAARRAGYAPKNSDVQAAQLLRDPEVQVRLKELMDDRSQKTGVTAARVVEELAKIGFASMRHFMSIDEDGQPRIDLGHTPEDHLDALAEVQTETVLEGGSDDPQHVRKTRIKLHDKLSALKLLAEHTGALKTPERQAADALQELVNAINQRGSAAPIAE